MGSTARSHCERGAEGAGVLAGGRLHPGLEAAIARTRGRGAKLAERARDGLGAVPAHAFAAVRVHADATADSLARALGARAFASGSDVYFARGELRPDSAEGRRLLAHELTHVAQRAAGPVSAPLVVAPPSDPAEREADRVSEGRPASGVLAAPPGRIFRQQRRGTAVTHPAGVRSPYRVIRGEFDGRDFTLVGEGSGPGPVQLYKGGAQSGVPRGVRPADRTACGGPADETYMNNPRYVGIKDFGPIPEGDYQFRVTEMALFSAAERGMIAGGNYTDPFGRPLHGGDWGAGRVALRPLRIVAGPRGCGNTHARSGFYLHGGILGGSSGCIDVGNPGYTAIVNAVLGFRGQIVVRVRYRHPPPTVGAVERLIGRFTYPQAESGQRIREPTLFERLGDALFGD